MCLQILLGAFLKPLQEGSHLVMEKGEDRRGRPQPQAAWMLRGQGARHSTGLRRGRAFLGTL